MAKLSKQKQRLDDLFQSKYKEIKRRAQYVSRRFRNTLLTPTALVSESYAKLASSDRLEEWPTGHFENVVGQTMKQVAGDQAREFVSQKRGGGEAVMIALDNVALDNLAFPNRSNLELSLTLNDCLRKLQNLDPRQANTFECRFLEGLSSRETAQKLGVSEPTIERDVRFLRAWMQSQLK